VLQVMRCGRTPSARSPVWITNGEDIPGLCVEAGTFDELVEIVLDLAPDLLRSNVALPAGTQVAITITAERRMTVQLPVGGVGECRRVTSRRAGLMATVGDHQRSPALRPRAV
jgi:hypothetical protein